MAKPILIITNCPSYGQRCSLFNGYIDIPLYFLTNDWADRLYEKDIVFIPFAFDQPKVSEEEYYMSDGDMCQNLVDDLQDVPAGVEYVILGVESTAYEFIVKFLVSEPILKKFKVKYLAQSPNDANVIGNLFYPLLPRTDQEYADVRHRPIPLSNFINSAIIDYFPREGDGRLERKVDTTQITQHAN